MARVWLHYGISMASPWERRVKRVASAWEGFGKGQKSVKSLEQVLSWSKELCNNKSIDVTFYHIGASLKDLDKKWFRLQPNGDWG